MTNLMQNLLKNYPELEPVSAEIDKAVDAIIDMYSRGGKLLLCGNGGSCADSSHISGELLKGFLLRRPMPEATRKLFDKNASVSAHLDDFQRGLCALPLPELSAVISAYANDVNPDLVYAQLVYAAGDARDVFLGISTSGNSKNVVYGAETAKALGLCTIALTGERESKLSAICDIVIKAPSHETFRVQEYHLPIYHYICAEVEARLFG